MGLDHKTFNDVVNFVSPYLDSEVRNDVLTRAFYGTSLAEIPQYGFNRDFATRLIRMLDQYGTFQGKPAVVHLLVYLREDKGIDVEEKFDQLIDAVNASLSASPLPESPVSPSVASPPAVSLPESKRSLGRRMIGGLIQVIKVLIGEDRKTVAQRLVVLLGLLISFLGFMTTVFWQPGAAIACPRQNFFDCGLYGPLPPNSDDFVIVVAGFGWQSDSGPLTQRAEADAVTLAIAKSLQNELTFEAQVISLKDAWFGSHLVQNAAVQSHILAPTPQERAAAAQQLAVALNADMVIYGVVREADNTRLYSPEFYVSDLQTQTSDVVQFKALDLLHREIVVSSPQTTLIQTGDLAERVNIIYGFMQAIASYTSSAYADSLAAFEAIVTQRPNDPDMALLYVLMGNAAGRAIEEGPETDDQQERLASVLPYYQKALVLKPNYTRGLIGMGEALTALFSGRGGFRYDESMTLPANINCLNYDLETITEEPTQWIGLLALDCYNKARTLTRNDKTVDAQEEFIRSSSGAGTIYLLLSNSGANHWGDASTAFAEGIEHDEDDGASFRPQSESSVGHLYARAATTQLLDPATSLTCGTRTTIAEKFAAGFERLTDFSAYQQMAEANCNEMSSQYCDVPANICSFESP